MLCLPGQTSAAPVDPEPTDSPAGESSGEELWGPASPGPQLLCDSSIWGAIISLIDGLKLQNRLQVEDVFLQHHQVSSLPAALPGCKSNKEACLHWVAEGLQTYMVATKHLESQSADNSLPANIRYLCGLLISQIKQQMKKPEKVRVLTSSEEEQLLKDIDRLDAFSKRMTALSILDQFRAFLSDSVRKIRQKEKAKQKRNGISYERTTQRN
uniref:Interleukin-6 n=1 Tax=Echeneis naucrates TaxID=173247 RepID=A0A665TJH3_ECHNA